jgi:hypothetical protein
MKMYWSVSWSSCKSTPLVNFSFRLLLQPFGVREIANISMRQNEHTLSTLSLHRSYTTQLAAERATNLELRQEHADFQGRLSDLSRLLREAHEYESGEVEAEANLEQLRRENEELREALGVVAPAEGTSRPGGAIEGAGAARGGGGGGVSGVGPGS